ncbi:MAG: hypothetical protein QOF73_2651 [Thermomicrobiales bacterium]|nr:hypothetical protein [Thermomicrobiales bacterium]
MGTPQPVVDAPSSALPLPILTAQEIGEFTDHGSVSRGRDYRRKEAIRQPIRRGRTLSALCRGSEPSPYRVRVVLADPTRSERKIASYVCTCPRGGFCKHIVALLLTWTEAPEEFEVLPTTAEILADQSRDDLLRLIDQMLLHDPSLESLVDRLRPVPPPPPAAPGEARLRTINQAAYRRKVARALSDFSYGREDEYDPYASYREYYDGESGYAEAAAQIQEFVTEGVKLEQAGRLADAIVVYATVAEEAIEFVDESGGDAISDVVLDCGNGLLRCLERQEAIPEGDRLQPDDRGELVEWLYNVWLFARGPGWGEEEAEEPADDEDVDEAPYLTSPGWSAITERGGRDAEAAIAAAATDAERARLQSWLRELLEQTSGEGTNYLKRAAIRFLFKLRREDGLSDEVLLEEFKRAELWDDAATLLLSMGRIEDAVALAGRHLTTTMQTLAFADRLRATGEEGPARAIRFVDGRLWETEGVKPRDDLAYLEWLSARYAELSLVRQAFEADRRIFKSRPAFRSYEAVRQAATRPGLEPDLWEKTRPKLIAELTKDRQWGTLIEIHLHEGQVAEAIAALKQMERPREGRASVAGALGSYGSYGYDGGHYRATVAKAAERDFPDEAIRIYRSLADAAINGRNRQSYATAANYLVSVRGLLEQHGREAEWKTLITGLREEHRRLRALKEELDALGLN